MLFQVAVDPSAVPATLSAISADHELKICSEISIEQLRWPRYAEVMKQVHRLCYTKLNRDLESGRTTLADLCEEFGISRDSCNYNDLSSCQPTGELQALAMGIMRSAHRGVVNAGLQRQESELTRVTACATEWLGQLSVRQALTAGTTPTATEDLLTTVKNVIRRSKLTMPYAHSLMTAATGLFASPQPNTSLIREASQSVEGTVSALTESLGRSKPSKEVTSEGNGLIDFGQDRYGDAMRTMHRIARLVADSPVGSGVETNE